MKCEFVVLVPSWITKFDKIVKLVILFLKYWVGGLMW